jgi:hypothetical protein
MRAIGVAVVDALCLFGCGAGGKAAAGDAGAAGNRADGSAGATASGGAGAGGAPSDAGSSDAGSIVTDASDASGFDPFAGGPTITVASMVYELGLPALIVLQDLGPAAGASGPTCTPVRYGDCIVDNCTNVDPNLPELSAGAITVSSPDAGVRIVASPTGETDYDSMPGDRAFGGGEALTVSTNGGDIPAFSVDLQAPLLLLVDQPTKPTLVPTTVAVAAPHTAPLTLTWTRGAPGVYMVAQGLAIQGFGGLGRVNARCFFDSRAGTGTIPAAVLSDVMVGQQFVLLTATAAVVQAGAQKVTVWLIGEALTPDKKNDVALDVQ